MVGADPNNHAFSNPGAKSLIEDGVGFSASEVSGTGLYFSFGYIYGSASDASVTVLSKFGLFHFTGATTCDNVHIVASSPALGSLADSDIQNWGCSIHEMFSLYPSTGLNAFIPLAIAKDATGPRASNFSDGTSGIPYILSRGTTPSGCGDGTWDVYLGEECDDGNTANGDGCSSACKCESGLPDGFGGCLSPPNATSTYVPPLPSTPPASFTPSIIIESWTYVPPTQSLTSTYKPSASINVPASSSFLSQSSLSSALTAEPTSDSYMPPIPTNKPSSQTTSSVSAITSSETRPSFTSPPASAIATPRPSPGSGLFLLLNYGPGRSKRQAGASYGYINSQGHFARTSDCNTPAGVSTAGISSPTPTLRV